MTLLARTDLDQKARSLGFSADGSHLAVGLGDGSFMVLKARYTVAKLITVAVKSINLLRRSACLHHKRFY